MSPLLSQRSDLEDLPFRDLRRPLVMGILNITPDSFYTESRTPDLDAALACGERLEQEGADIIDIGGESTRPGADPVSEEEELARILPVVEALAKRARVPLSIDTSKAAIAVRALEAGATILNDISALRADAAMAAAAVRYKNVILMHMLGDSPRAMQNAPAYEDVVGDISDFFRARLKVFKEAGGDSARVWLDPGIGFGKTVDHNFEIFSRLEEFRALGRPVVIGASRKSFIGKALGSEEAPVPTDERLEGSLASACRAAQAGAICVRVHDVAQTRRALEIWARLRRRA